MADKHRLLPDGSGQYNNGIHAQAGYGSVGAYYERVSSEERDFECRPPRFVYRKRDCVIISVLGALVVASVVVTLAIGLPKILQKTAEIHPPVVVGQQLHPHGFTPITSVVQTNLAAMPDPASVTLKSSIGVHPSGAVTSNCPQCSSIAADVLRLNGSSVDAAIAATFCLSVCDVHHTGLGGGFLMTIYKRANGEAEAIDARETAPSGSNGTMFPTTDSSARGALSVAVPGLVAGLWEAHRRHGQLNWSSLLEPSIKLAENGIQVGMSLAAALEGNRKGILEQATMRSLLVNPSTGDVYQKGDTVKQPALAKTLRILADKGGNSFYTGQLAKDLVRDINDLGGIVTLDDLGNYTVRIQKPATVNFVKSDGQRLRLYSSPAPGSGHLLSFFLNIMEGYDYSSNGSSDTVVNLQRMTEAFKFVYAHRSRMADPDFADLTELISNLTSKKYATEIRQQIRDNMTYPSEHYGAEISSPPDSGTSHVSIVASNGDAVSVTSTINEKFGAVVASTSTGIILNNEMDDFDIPNVTNVFEVQPSGVNSIEPGKRPLSSMCPTIITNGDGDVVLVTGAAGGLMITSATAQVILRHLWMDQDLEVSTDALRIHHQLFPNVLLLETGFPRNLEQGLRDIGHEIEVHSYVSIVNSVGRKCTGGLLTAVADKRADASQAGF